LCISDLHVFGFDDFDGKPLIFILIFDTFIDFAAISTADEIFEVEAVAPNLLFSIALVVCLCVLEIFRRLEGAIGACEMDATCRSCCLTHFSNDNFCYLNLYR
jgi:hypothetical protein